ncbi:MAG: (E)-4-hydroxy-3-methylbut-2-enyl-diphosphate synthase [Candidatus Omnitrophica bacterium]|nr:(E)-4-hydroxy-3-methylbut-2-enyl-diphosphate synthase [Candidatus Omnitrophota bacterium]
MGKIREVKIGSLCVGKNNPVRIKGMLKSSTSDTDKLIEEAKRLKEEGAEAIRVAVKEKKDISLAKILKREVILPIVADVHFDYRLALSSVCAGFDGVRLNPLNITKISEVTQIVKEAKINNISLRIGINSGGFKKDFSSPKKLADSMIKVVKDYIKLFEKQGFFDTIVSFKAADAKATILANENFRREFDYPLHLGVTASGPFLEGIIKSSLGIGILLYRGIGEIVRVSLTGPSFWEIRVAKFILQFLGIRSFSCEVISCPTCSRCEVDLVKIVDKVREEIDSLYLGDIIKRVAVMGCVVNGPGEAYQADIGLAFGKKKGAIFRKDKILGWTNQDRAVRDLIKFIREIENNKEKK